MKYLSLYGSALALAFTALPCCAQEQPGAPPAGAGAGSNGQPGGPFGPGGPGGPFEPHGPGGKPHAIDTQGVKRKWLDISYATLSPAEKLDIYLPDEQFQRYPVIVAVHGGGFDGGDKNSGEVNAPLTGLKRGYAVVTVNYRLSGEAVFPAAILDLKAAVRFIKANAVRYRLDPDRVVIWGDSAGANLASLLGTSAARGELEDAGIGNGGVSSRVRAVVDWFGPTNFLTMDSLSAQAGTNSFMVHNAATSSESRYLGKQITTIPELVAKADPTSYISAQSPPFFIENGSADPIVPPQQSRDFAAALTRAIGSDKVEYHELAGAGHGGPAFEATDNLDKVFAFLSRFDR